MNQNTTIDQRKSTFLSWFEPPIQGMATEVTPKNLWLVRLRWVAILAQIICIVPGIYFGFIRYSDLGLYLTVVATLIGLNCGITLFGSRILHREWTVLAQLVFDLSALSALLLLAGGCHNPFSSLIYLNATLGPLLLTGVYSGIFLVGICTSLAVVCFNSSLAVHLLNGPHISHEMNILVQMIVICVIWLLCGWLSKNIKHVAMNLLNLQKQQSRIDNLRTIGAMAGSFAHEFATPLNTVKMRLDRIGRKAPQIASEEDFGTALEALNQCEEVLHGLFGEKLTHDSVHMNQVDIVKLVKSICNRWVVDYPQTRLSFSANPDETISCRIPESVFVRSIIDILDNAVQASTIDQVEIEVSIKVLDSKACLEISDRGCGFPKQFKEKLGEPFLTSRETGSGLGLYTAYSLFNALGGFLNILDRQGGGTRVQIGMPLAGSAGACS